MDTAALAKLLSPTGWNLLGALPPYDEKLAMPMGQALRDKGVDADLVAALLTQSRLRTRATDKFGEFAAGMLFTQDGLEQATRLPVAARHAQRFLDAGASHVADLTCGIGADSLAFAGVELRVSAYEIDELTAALATVNLRHFPEATVRHGDGLTADLTGLDGLFADPARRTRSGARVFDPHAYAPDLDAVLALRDRVPALGVKVGPGLPHAGLPEDAEVQWVSIDGDVVEAGLWFGPLAPHGPGRSVLVLRSQDGGLRSHYLAPVAQEAQAETGPLSQYLFEPDGAVIRAGRVASVARELGGHLIDPTIAYV
ncbi:MAG: SAM-dependent methyltransferase, partial [Cellulomonadaceae bacterium]